MAAKTQKLNTQDRAKIFNALSDSTRLMIVEQLRAGEEKPSKEIAEALGITLALYCHHSTILVEAGILQKRKQGQSSYYSLQQDVLSACFESLKL